MRMALPGQRLAPDYSLAFTRLPLALRPNGIPPAAEDWEAPERSAPVPKTEEVEA